MSLRLAQTVRTRAFVAAFQHLPPRQRALLVLRDGLGVHGAEVADMLKSSEASIKGALQRARATLDTRLPAGRERAPLPGVPLRLVTTRANGQPAFGCYLPDPQAAIAHAYGLLVLTLKGDRISAITWFFDRGLFPNFGSRDASRVRRRHSTAVAWSSTWGAGGWASRPCTASLHTRRTKRGRHTRFARSKVESATLAGGDAWRRA